MKPVKAFILSLMLALGLATSANAEKMYSKEDAEAICASAVNGLLDDLTALSAKGLTPEQLKQAVMTKDPEIKALIHKFIDEVVTGRDKEATATLLLIHATCSQKLQEVEV